MGSKLQVCGIPTPQPPPEIYGQVVSLSQQPRPFLNQWPSLRYLWCLYVQAVCPLPYRNTFSGLVGEVLLAGFPLHLPWDLSVCFIPIPLWVLMCTRAHTTNTCASPWKHMLKTKQVQTKQSTSRFPLILRRWAAHFLWKNIPFRASSSYTRNLAHTQKKFPSWHNLDLIYVENMITLTWFKMEM